MMRVGPLAAVLVALLRARAYLDDREYGELAAELRRILDEDAVLGVGTSGVRP